MPTDKEMLDWLDKRIGPFEIVHGGHRYNFVHLHNGSKGADSRRSIAAAMEAEPKAELDKAWEWFKAGINGAEYHMPIREVFWTENLCKWVVRWSNHRGHNDEVYSTSPKDAILRAWRKDTQGKE